MTALENCICTLISVFQRYAGKDGDPKTLSNAEVRDLLKAELPSLIANPRDKAAMDQIMLDLSGDGKVDFKEFAITVVSLSVCCHEMLKA